MKNIFFYERYLHFYEKNLNLWKIFCFCEKNLNCYEKILICEKNWKYLLKLWFTKLMMTIMLRYFIEYRILLVQKLESYNYLKFFLRE